MLGYIILIVCRASHHWIFFFLHQEISVCHFFGKNISLSGVKVLQIVFFSHNTCHFFSKNISLSGVKVLQIVFFSHNTKLILLPNFREINILQNKYTL